jgi:serine/threonine protein kinase
MALSSNESFLELVQKSGVVEPNRLTTYLDGLRATNGYVADPGKLAGLMVRDAILTNFQAEQLLAGKWRGFHVGKYKVLERLGSGGMGTVYLAEHKFMKRRVALKVLPRSKASDAAALERFYREAKAVAALDHPNIVRAYDIDQDGDLHYLVMEYVDGASLQEIVKTSGPLDFRHGANYIHQAARGIQHAHAVGLVHRDIKPGNLLVERTGIVKVLDMGLARFFNDEEDILTKKYDENVLGTADYLAPEQALDSHSVDIRADIYSLGCTFYFTLTGRSPFGEGTVAQKLIWHQTRRPKPIKDLRAETPGDLIAIIDRMMHKNPAGRYQLPEEVVQALDGWTEGAPLPPPLEALPKLSPAAAGSAPATEIGGGSSTVNQSMPRQPSSIPTSPAPGHFLASSKLATPREPTPREDADPRPIAARANGKAGSRRDTGAASAPKGGPKGSSSLPRNPAAASPDAPTPEVENFSYHALATLETRTFDQRDSNRNQARPSNSRPDVHDGQVARPRRAWLMLAVILVGILGVVGYGLFLVLSIGRG